MIVSVKVSLKEATQSKAQKLHAVLRRMRACTRRYIQSLWETPGKLDAVTLNRIDFPQLGYRQRQTCLKIALETVVAAKKSAKALGKTASCPKVPRRLRLSTLVCNIEPGKGSFDYVLKISSLVCGQRVVIPFKSHKVLNKWLAVSGAKLLQGAAVTEEDACLWISVPDEIAPDEGTVLAVDAGVCKLLVDSDGNRYGEDCRRILDKARRRKPGGKGKARALAERRCYLNRIVKQLPWGSVAAIAHEDLRNIKRGKKPNRGKSFRKLIAPWTIRQVFARIEFLAARNRVRVLAVDPRDTSRRCPSCLTVRAENRKGERFCCVSCGHEQDADEVGAINILSKALETLGSLWSPSSPNLEMS